MQSVSVNPNPAALRKLHIEQFAKASVNTFMGADGGRQETAPIDVNAIRKANLRRLIGQCGSVTQFAARVETNADYISSIIADGGKRNPGDQLMRRVEVAFQLSAGSLDFPEERSVAAAMAIQSLNEEAQQQVFDFIRYKIESADAPIVGEHAASYLTMIDNLKRDMKARQKKKPPK
jgi:hypothetical protein